MDQNADWIDLDPMMLRPFKRARILKVPFVQENYIDTTMIDLAEIISQELPAGHLANIMQADSQASEQQNALIIVNELEQVLGGVIYREYEMCSISELTLLAVKQKCQGFGLGTCLISRLIAEHPKVQVCVDLCSETFFRKLGFVPIEQDSFLNGTRLPSRDCRILMYERPITREPLKVEEIQQLIERFQTTIVAENAQKS